MRVLIFGASGGIGRHVRAQARSAGHDLVLFARDPENLKPLHVDETSVEGDMADALKVGGAVAGVDAVISVLGPTSNSPDQVDAFESFARTLVGAMDVNGVRRLVAISGGACTLPGERKRLGARMASSFVRLMVRHVVDAKQRELEVIGQSDLDWVAPRPARVVDVPLRGKFRVGESARGMSIGQADLAQFMVAALTDDTHLRQAPFISY